MTVFNRSFPMELTFKEGFLAPARTLYVSPFCNPTTILYLFPMGFILPACRFIICTDIPCISSLKLF